MDPFRRARLGLAALFVIVGGGTVGYLMLGFSFLDAVYQTVTTISTVGFREVEPLTGAGKVFTMALILAGVGTALYTFGVLVEGLVEGQLQELLGRRRMERRIARRSGHVVVCGYGRVGRAITARVAGAGQQVVVVDRDPARLAGLTFETVLGDANDETVLRSAGIERARVLVAALSSDADNLYLTLTGRSLGPQLFIVARARIEPAEAKLVQAGADRVVNPQRIGGQRMAAFVLQPHVAEFLDVVMHDGSLEFRLAEIVVPDSSSLAGRSLRDAHIRDRTGALVLALRSPEGEFVTNPTPETAICPGHVLIAIGTGTQLDALEAAAAAGGATAG